jgi:hypothetical protein
LKYRLVVEKDRGNTWKKIQEKNEPFFVAILFKGLSFYMVLTVEALDLETAMSSAHL